LWKLDIAQLEARILLARASYVQDEVGTPAYILEVTGGNRQQYAVSRDGKRFLINVPTETTTVSPITVILNWNPVPKK